MWKVLANCGPLVPNKEALESALLYDEFVVYDEAQVKAKYLVLVDFDFGDEE